jgi:hypothetical protein
VGAYIFAVENAVTITGLVVAAAEIASGIPNPVAGELNAIKGAVCTAAGAMTLWPAANNGRIIINGIEYTTHALERMQPMGTIIKGKELYSRGLPPSVIENAIKNGTVSAGNTLDEVVRTFENVKVVTNPSGNKVITVFPKSRN